MNPRKRSSLKPNYLLAVATVPIIEKYGIDAILKPFVREINELTEKGITIS